MRLRTFAWWLLGCVAAAVVVRVLAFDVDALRRADLDLLTALDAPPWSRSGRLAAAVLWPFDPAPFAVLVLAVAAAGYLGGRPVAALAAAGSMLGAAVTTQALKPLLAEPRPLPGGTHVASQAWPSGHTTAAASLALALVLITPPGRRRPVAAAGAVLVAAVGVSLVVRAIHYPSDVVGGALVAGAWAAVAFAVVALLRQRRRTSTAAAEGSGSDGSADNDGVARPGRRHAVVCPHIRRQRRNSRPTRPPFRRCQGAARPPRLRGDATPSQLAPLPSRS